MTSGVLHDKRTGERFKYPSAAVVAFMRGFAYLSSRLFWSIRYHGLENIPSPMEGGVVVVSNHPTYFDPAWISVKLRHPLRYMAWDEAFNWKFVGKMIRYLGAFPVKLRSGPAKSTIVESLRSLREGAALVIFPEGEREFADGKLQAFKSGALHIAHSAGVPVLPVSISGGNKVWPQGQKYPRFFQPVEVTYHPLINLPSIAENGSLDEKLEEVNCELMKTIASAV